MTAKKGKKFQFRLDGLGGVLKLGWGGEKNGGGGGGVPYAGHKRKTDDGGVNCRPWGGWNKRGKRSLRVALQDECCSGREKCIDLLARKEKTEWGVREGRSVRKKGVPGNSAG